jgi:hypothetical protein
MKNAVDVSNDANTKRKETRRHTWPKENYESHNNLKCERNITTFAILADSPKMGRWMDGGKEIGKIGGIGNIRILYIMKPNKFYIKEYNNIKHNTNKRSMTNRSLVMILKEV